MKKEAFDQHIEMDLRIAGLIRRSLSGQLEEHEQKILNDWANAASGNRDLLAQLKDPSFQIAAIEERGKIDLELPFNRIKDIYEQKRSDSRSRLRFIIGVAAAASVLMIISLGVKYTRNTDGSKGITMPVAQTIVPARPTALLVTGTGPDLQLNNSMDSVLSNGAIQVSGGMVKYENGEKSISSMQHLIVPRGGKYRLELEDGTKVWLNALSDIRFPASFGSGERSVEVSGEAYFEVAPRSGSPFIVQTKGVSVQVLGTSFNIRNYEGEAPTATLVSGKVRVGNGAANSKLLAPGQMGTMTGGNVLISEADMDQVLAWKKDQFICRNAGLKQIMDEIGRWYNVGIEYREPVSSNQGITFEISRNVPLDKVLEMLEASGAGSFSIEGRTITVTENRR